MCQGTTLRRWRRRSVSARMIDGMVTHFNPISVHTYTTLYTYNKCHTATTVEAVTALEPPSTLTTMSLSTVPQEILEHIAFFSATESLLGPPSELVPLLSTSRRIHSYLSTASNPVLFARVFAHKFDVAPIVRRLGPQAALPAVLSIELRQRCSCLKRIRARLDSTIPHPSDEETLEAVLWVAYLMMLENDGKNEKQLREYAKIDGWLQEYWFDDHGASLAKSSIRADRWPPSNRKTSLAMWLFWFLLRPGLFKNVETTTSYA